MKETITYDEAHKFFNYNPITGILTNKITRKFFKAGTEAGRIDSKGYKIVGFKGKQYQAHRLIWFYMYGYFPEHNIDHINKNKIDNRLCNLREVTKSCNARNCNLDKRNKSGVNGVNWDKRDKRWRARINIFGKNHHLGNYENLSDAVKARYEKEKEVNWNLCDENSTAYQYLKENGLI